MKFIFKTFMPALICVVFINYKAVMAAEFPVRNVDIALCEQAIKDGNQISNTQKSYQDISYCLFGEKYYRITISTLNLFNVKITCEELSSN